MRRSGWIVLYLKIASAANPLIFSYDRNFGPDGPWQALDVLIGGQNVSLYPGAIQSTRVNGVAMCEDGCLASQAGIYDRSLSHSAADPFDDLPSHYNGRNDLNGYSRPRIMSLAGSAGLMSDDIELTDSSGQSYTVENIAITLINESRVEMPDGTSYATQVGFLGMGLPLRPWTYGGARTNHTPGGLADEGIIPSNSYGLHIGSAPHGQSGSLVLGGYDRSRVVGLAGRWSFELNEPPTVTLEQIGFGVETGQNPFNPEPTGNFLARSFPSGISASFDATVPYMFLPSQVCEAFAEVLPVARLDAPGLYAWDTSSPAYNEIVNSAAYIAFTFSGSSIGNVTIKVPFQLLNLTLQTPIVDSPTPYFPCKPSDELDFDDDDDLNIRGYFGRAFLQAAYLAIQFDREVFWLAQAPGPDSGESYQVSLGGEDEVEADEEMTFDQSWLQSWSLNDETQSGGSGAQDNEDSESGLNAGSIAGIVVGIAAVLVVALLLVFVFVIRPRQKNNDRNRRANPHYTDNMSEVNTHERMEVPAIPASLYLHEVPAKPSSGFKDSLQPVEMDTQTKASVRMAEME